MYQPSAAAHDSKTSQGFGLMIVLAWLAVHLGSIFGPPVAAWSPVPLSSVLLLQT